MERNERNFRILEFSIHVMTWMAFFFFPQKIFMREDGFSDTLSHLEPYLLSQGLLMVGFYVNYFWFVPQMLRSHNIRRLVIINIFFFILLQSTGLLWDYSAQIYHEESNFTQRELMHEKSSVCEKCRSMRDTIQTSSSEHITFSCKIEDEYTSRGTPNISENLLIPDQRNILTLIGYTPSGHLLWWLKQICNFLVCSLLVNLCVVLRMAFRFRQEEMARKQAELRQTETELQSLKNQISPHFLLNTLNNIYALVIMDQNKAQEAIINLSRLLSRMLYHGRDTYVSLEREIDFLRSYVDLMQLRISQSVHVEFVANVGDCGKLPIAPYILVSLVENAFKHGIHGNQGYIHFHLQASTESGIIRADIRNSNYPKSSDDKSGHGVGLTQVQRRLDLVYPDRYEWDKGVDLERNEYYSILTIHTR